MARGYAFLGDRLLQGGSLATFLDERSDEFASALTELNGFFAAVRVSPKSLVAAVDRIRSIPIFYAHKAEDVYVSDDAYWVAEQFPEDPYGQLSMAEFLLVGYVTGSDTLHPNVKQLQAGEMLLVDETPNGIRVATKTYYRYSRHDCIIGRKELLVAELDAVYVAAFQRLVRSVGDRPIVIPLSGGYDSRLVAIMLRRLGYENVICFSYGVLGNRDSLVSEQVARKLGYEWEFIPYSQELWHRCFHSDDYKSYVRYADGLTSIAHPQDWPAVWTLKKQRIVPEDSVFVPGHTAMFSVPDEFSRTDRMGPERLVDAIERHHYNLWDLRILEALRAARMPARQILSRLKAKILGLCDSMSCETPDDAAEAYERWLWRERYAKFIVNSVRAYEFWRYEWRIPLFDAEVLSFRGRIPLSCRLEKRFYKDYVEKAQAQYGLQQPSANYPERYYLEGLLHDFGLLEAAARSGLLDSAERVLAASKRLLGARSFEKVGRALVRVRRSSYRAEYQIHPLAWYGIMSKCQFRALYSLKPANICSFLSLERLGLVSY